MTKFVLPPGDADVSNACGSTDISRSRVRSFTSYDIQAKINELSKRGRGKVEDVKNQNVVSNFQGRFKLGGGTLRLPDLTFAVPGAKVELAGSYALSTKRSTSKVSC